jgi:protein SCO1/2
MHSVSLDPKVDTPEVLARYAEAIGARPGWTFLTGEPEDIERLRRSVGLYDLDPALDADRTRHAGILVYGNEPTGAWGAVPALADPDAIAGAVLRVTRRAGAGGSLTRPARVLVTPR